MEVASSNNNNAEQDTSDKVANAEGNNLLFLPWCTMIKIHSSWLFAA